MHMQLQVGDDSFRIELLLFSGGKRRITLNKQRVYEGMATPDSPATFDAEGRQYVVAKEGKSYRIKVTQQGEELHNGLYDTSSLNAAQPNTANPNAAEGKNVWGVQVCGFIGAVLGVAFMIVGNILTGVIPGGAIGGFIGAAIGGALGRGLGAMIRESE